jgi:structure-specific endonuclease subunit SLX1
MISIHPYSTWPLHVKLFTDEAVKWWQDAAKGGVGVLTLPPGFTCNIELEGVDGKSGIVGSGRQGPISVKDGNVICPHRLPASSHPE